MENKNEKVLIMVCEKYICDYLYLVVVVVLHQGAAMQLASAHIVHGGSRTNRVAPSATRAAAASHGTTRLLVRCAALRSHAHTHARARACTNRVPRIRARFNARTMSQLAYTIL